jgi:iron-sulfur cluster assembly protein
VAIHVEESAAKKIVELASKTGKPPLLRIGVKGGGCSGLSYHLDLTDKPPGKFDKVFEKDGAQVIVDQKSYLYLNNTHLIWEDKLTRQGFKFENPNVKNSCGCGESFTV